MSYCRACGLTWSHWAGCPLADCATCDGLGYFPGPKAVPCRDCQSLDAPPIRREAS